MNPTPYDEDRVTVRGAGLTWRETGDEIVVLDLDGSVYFGLNGPGATLWRQLVSPTRRSELMDRLRHEGADEGQAGRDVDAFLTQLDGYGLLHRERAPGTD